MSLPFELRIYHKGQTRYGWERIGIIFLDEEHFEYIYNEYIHATNCDLCNKQFPTQRDRQLDHDHETGDVRNIVCCKCNQRRKDNKIYSNNTGEQYITKKKKKDCKFGYCFTITIKRNGKYILQTSRNTLEKAIKCRDEFLAVHPEIFS